MQEVLLRVDVELQVVFLLLEKETVQQSADKNRMSYSPEA